MQQQWQGLGLAALDVFSKARFSLGSLSKATNTVMVPAAVKPVAVIAQPSRSSYRGRCMAEDIGHCAHYLQPHRQHPCS